MSAAVKLELTYEVASALVNLANVMRAEERHELGLQKTVRASKSVTAATKEIAEAAKSLDAIRSAMAAGDERRLKARLAALEQEAQSQSKLRAMEAQRMGELGRQRYEDRELRMQGLRLQERLTEGIRISAQEMRQLPALTKEQVAALTGLPAPAEKAAKATRTMAESASLGLGSLRGMVAGWVSIGSAIQFATRLVEEYDARMQRIRGTNLSLAEQQATFIRQAAGESPVAMQAAMADIPAMAQRTKFGDPAALQGALNKALAAYGGDIPAALGAVEAAAPLGRGSQAEVEALSVAGLSLAKSTGRTDPKWNIGLAGLIGKFARPEDPSLQARNIGQALARAAPYSQGDRERISREGGAVYAAMTQMGEDVTGEEAAGAYYRVQQQMREFIGKWGMEDPQYPLARIKLLRDNPDLAREFMEHAEFGHQRFKSTFEEFLFSPETSPANKFLAAGVAGIGKGDPAAVYEEQKRMLETATPQLRQQVRSKEGEATQKVADLRKTSKALRAEAKTSFDKAIADTRGYYADKSFLSAMAEMAAIPVSEMMTPDDPTMVREYIKRTQSRQQDILDYRTGPFGGPRTVDQLNQTERADYQALQETLVQLNKTLVDMQRTMPLDGAQRGGAAAQAEAGLPMH